MSWVYYVGKFLVWLLVHLLTRWRVSGRENVPDEGPLLIVANHLHLSDPPILGLAVDRKVRFMAKEELFRSRFTGYFIRNFGAFPVYRGRLDRKAIKQAHHWLEQGTALVMFPEGKRSKNAQLQPAFSGSALIASDIGVPILPAGITGTEKIKGMTWWLRRPEITVNIGHPFYLPPMNGKRTKTELARLTDSIMEHIAELLPQEYRGHYGRDNRT